MFRAAEYIQNIFGKSKIETAIILGSGFSSFADKASVIKRIPYNNIPGFPVSTVKGHAGELVLAEINSVPVIIMNGRFHYYEGYSMGKLAFPVRTLRCLGVNTLIVTNAAGGINPIYNVGDLVLITDHIKFFDDSPLRGINDESGERFVDMTAAYSKELIAKAQDAARKAGMTLREGVYAFMSGPSFETPAEIKALSALGADLVGMSTVPEVITAVHAGMRLLGISVVTNKAAGLPGARLNHSDVCAAGAAAAEKFSKIISLLFPL